MDFQVTTIKSIRRLAPPIEGGFTVTSGGRPLVRVDNPLASRVEVSFTDPSWPTRMIDRDDITPTIKLFCIVQTKRKNLTTCPTMILR